MRRLNERARLLDQRGRILDARNAYLQVLALDPANADALADLGALLFRSGYTSAARTVFTQAVAAHPLDAGAHVNLANLLRQADAPDAARAAYETALRLQPGYPEAHQGLAILLDDLDPQAAAHHRQRGFADRVLTTAPGRGNRRKLRVLQLVSARGGNIPTAQILDDRTCLVHSLVAEFADPGMALPPHDVVFNAIGDADRCAEALAAAARLLAGRAAPVLNPPDRISATTRVANAQRLAALPGVIVPRIALLPRAAFADGVPAGFAPPFLLRSPGYHTGQHFRRVEATAALPDAVASLPGEALMALQYLDATGADGAARKYRVMFIGGRPWPLHLAISADWKVHYFTADMASRADHRAEEARFLSDMPGVLGPVAMGALDAIGAVLGLDYGGVDFALAPDGRVLLFEANATMVMAPPPPDPMWAYRRPAILRAIAAAQALVTPAARRSGVQGVKPPGLP